MRAGFDGTSMDEVARSAGVTRLIVYRIFTSKEELYRAVLEQVTARLGEEFATIVADGPRTGRGRRRPSALGPHAGPGRGRRATRPPRSCGSPARTRMRFACYGCTPPTSHPSPPTTASSARSPTPWPRTSSARTSADPTLRAWAAPTLVAHLYDGVIAWLDRGRPEQDDAFVAAMSRGVRALVAAWAAGAG